MKKLLVISTLFVAPLVGAEEVEWELFLPAVSDPLFEEFPLASVRSFDGQNFDELSYILRSQETGYYPNWGWTGEYYITGVTHGQVNSEEIELIETFFFDDPEELVPEPSSLTVLAIGSILLLRRRRTHED